MIYQVFSFLAETKQQEGYSLDIEFENLDDAFEYIESNKKSGFLFRIEKITPTGSVIIHDDELVSEGSQQ